MSFRIITKVLKQDAVYWAPKTCDDFNHMQYDSPVPIKVRWVDVEKAFLDSQGAERVSKAQVMTSIDVLPQGVLWLGLLADVTPDVHPLKNEGAGIIGQFKKVPTIKADKFVRIAMLSDAHG